MRVLCLHGFRTSGGILKEQMKTLMKSLEWEFIFLDAPHRSPKDAKLDEGVELAFPKLTKLGVFEWYNAPTQSGSMEYSGMSESIALVKETLIRERVDVLLGFSQGGCFAWIITALCEQNKLGIPAHLRPKLTVLINANFPRDSVYSALPCSMTPFVLCFGARDTVIDASKWTSLSCKIAHRVVTEETHALPRTAASVNGVVTAMQACARRRWFAFDFDGVVCDSALETGKTALCAFRAVFPGVDIGNEKEIVQAFCVARPLLETGFEAIVILYRLVVLRENPAYMVASPHAKSDMESALLKMNLSEHVLKEAFQVARDGWIASNEKEWLEENKFYANTVSCIKELIRRGESVYVVTTKHASFAGKLLEQAGIQNFPSQRLFGLGSGKKRQVLAQLASTQEAELGGHCVFVEDRLETLRDVSMNGNLPVTLCLAGYGYNTPEERVTAKEEGFMVCETSHDLKEWLLSL